MLIDFLPRHTEDDGQPQGGDGKQRATDVLDRYGKDALKLAEKLAESLSDNYSLREKNRTLRQEVADFKAKQAPDGARVLTKEESEAYDAYTALGKPSDIKSELDTKSTAEQELTTLRRKQQLYDVHALTGFDPDVLGEIGANWQFITKEEQSDGGTSKVVYVKEGDQEQRIDQHPKVQKYLPALKPDVAPGTGYVAQSTGDKPVPAPDKATQFIAQQAEQRSKQPNPLMKQGVS